MHIKTSHLAWVHCCCNLMCAPIASRINLRMLDFCSSPLLVINITTNHACSSCHSEQSLDTGDGAHVYKAMDVVLELLVKLGKAMDTMFMATMPQPPTGNHLGSNLWGYWDSPYACSTRQSSNQGRCLSCICFWCCTTCPKCMHNVHYVLALTKVKLGSS